MSLVISCAFAVLLVHSRGNNGVLYGLAVFATWVLSYIIPVGLLCFAFYKSLDTALTPLTRFRVIVLTYSSTIVIFANAYFSMAFVSDHQYAVRHYEHYYYEKDRGSGLGAHVIPYTGSPRAFASRIIYGALSTIGFRNL